MRFCDLFIEYKIGLKSIKDSIPWHELPLYRKILMTIIFIFIVISIIFLAFQNTYGSILSLFICFLLFIVFNIIDSSQRNLKVMLDEHYSKYSIERINMLISVLDKYSISPNDLTKIDLLISQAEASKATNDPLAHINKAIKTLSSVIIPIIVFVAQKIAEASNLNEIIYLATQAIIIIICFISIIPALWYHIKMLIYKDYNKYDDLIYDLNQLKLFY